MRPLVVTERTTGCRAACTSVRASTSRIPVASRTTAAGCPSSSVPSPVRARTGARSRAEVPAVRWSRPPSRPGPPGVWRERPAGRGRPRRRVRERTGAVPVERRSQAAVEAGPAGGVAGEGGGPGEAEAAGEEAAGGGAGEAQVAVGHVRLPAGSWGLARGPPRAYSGVRLPEVILGHG